MKPRRLAAAVAASACAATVTALAAGSYSVRPSVSSPVISGHSFSVKARGVAKKRALLYVYLDRKACLATTNKEASREFRDKHRSDESYFLQTRGRRNVKETWNYGWVSGSFTKSFTAHAGTVTGREHACAYLDTANKFGGYRVTAAHASTSYTVKG